MVELEQKIPGPNPLPFIGNIFEFGWNTKGTVYEISY
jgi:hypothetical protein